MSEREIVWRFPVSRRRSVTVAWSNHGVLSGVASLFECAPGPVSLAEIDTLIANLQLARGAASRPALGEAPTTDETGGSLPPLTADPDLIGETMP